MPPNCSSQPFVLISAQTSCAESPPCSHIFCWQSFNCLIASTLSPIISGCRLDGEDIFCICSTVKRNIFRKMASSTAAFTTTTTTSTSTPTTTTTTTIKSQEVPTTLAIDSNNLSGGAIAGIVIACVVGVLLIAIVGFFLIRYIKDRRKNHGEYRPQFEEQHHAKDLPYLQPPNIEGLI